jgi:hypothetical protein
MPRILVIGLVAAIVAGCAGAYVAWDEQYGPAAPRNRLVAPDSAEGRHFDEAVRPLIEHRCAVCHGCYDAPCQLNLTAPEGIDRGATKARVYDAARLKAVTPTGLINHRRTTTGWREQDFFAVLNEHGSSVEANHQASILYHLLELKRAHPLPEARVLDAQFDLGLDRDEQCPNPAELDAYKANHPLWGMPYALPGLADAEHATLVDWLAGGAAMAQPAQLSGALVERVNAWEAFLNGDGLTNQLMSRYLFEHWFLAHLYFPDLEPDTFFRIARSRTPPGQPMDPITTRRPYDDPGVARVYYRLWRDHTTVLDKTHMPYSLSAQRMDWLSKLFLAPAIRVDRLPGYESANPFATFAALPVDSRWSFLQAEAQFTVMNFIKGAVCRGQIALDVIRDHFWVFFTRPGAGESHGAAEFMSEEANNLEVPTEAGSTVMPMKTWVRYSRAHKRYLDAKSKFLERSFEAGLPLDETTVWDGDGANANAALTVFRHFDSASVVQGLVGDRPNTFWLIDYTVLERIHYLLVAGYDVFGNLGHQLTTRLYMDFLRMEGELNFLILLPPEARERVSASWYQGADDVQRDYFANQLAILSHPSDIDYHTDDPLGELIAKLKQHLAPVLNHAFDLDHPDVPADHRVALERLAGLQGLAVSRLPEAVYLSVVSPDGAYSHYTVLHNNAHTNITSLFDEAENREPERDTVTVVRGFIGSYPDTFWRVREDDLEALVDAVATLTDEDAYARLMDRFGVRRTSPEFWSHSDRVMAAHHAADPVAHGLLDYNRLENR